MGVLLLLFLGLGRAGKGIAVEAGLHLGGGDSLAGGGAGGCANNSGEAVNRTRVVNNHRPFVALGQCEALVSEGGLEVIGSACGGPGVQHHGADLGQRDAGALLMMPFIWRQRRDGALAEGVPSIYQGAVHVGAFLAKGGQDGLFVTTGTEGNAVVKFPAALNRLARGEIMGKPDGGAVLTDG
ncbi:hypothetical protein IHV25_06055 [Phaeovibrio sulfidiphilus]|uniref:Uncharacterized protein n=1 Tax=Phaeovibrio sulfidiphilus TaxID=1220600 RepID=A0A8J6YNU9_9PROT|nr:hypothetical protein [Phaeovibrio sulfidiphilus]MBE1237209.1 hypothetical protein [Phaeovibrio sulfidiphilus]